MNLSTKKCSTCQVVKPINEFNKKSSGKFGVAGVCKVCKRKSDKKYNEARRDKLAEKAKSYRKKNKDKITKYNKEYNEKSKVARSTANKEYYDSNKEAVALQMKLYAASEPGKAVMRAAQAKRQAAKRATQDGSVTPESLQELIVAQNYSCYICNCDLAILESRHQHVDHIIPLIPRAGEPAGTHTLDNMAWACSTCNVRKSNIPLGIFLQEKRTT